MIPKHPTKSFRLLSVSILSVAVALGVSTAAQAQFKERTVRMAAGIGKDHPLGHGMAQMAQCISDKSGGKIRQRNYNDNALGSELAIAQQTRSGTLDLLVVTTTVLAGTIPELGILDLPYLMTNEKEVDALFGSKALDHFIPKYEAAGLEFLTYWEYGFRNATNSKRPINKWEDMQGLKFRVMQNKVYLDTFAALGSTAVPLPFGEVYSALETKAVDGQENPVMAIETMKFNEVQKYLSLTRHTYSTVGIFYSKKLFDQLSNDEKAAFKSCATDATPYVRQLARTSETKSLENLRKSGMTVNALQPAEVERIREKLKPVYDAQLKAVGPETTGIVMGELKRIRAQ